MTIPTNMAMVDTAVKEVIMAEMVVYTMVNHGSADGAVAADTGNGAANLVDDPAGARLHSPAPMVLTIVVNVYTALKEVIMA